MPAPDTDDLLHTGETTKAIAEQLDFAKPTDSLLRKDLRKLLDVKHEQKIREIEVNAMLHDLMANDEIISSHEPSNVIRIYNELSQMAPRVSSQQMLLRSLLRKRLQYGGDQVDPFEVQQLLDIENKLRERDSLGRNIPTMYGIGPLGRVDKL